MMGDDMAVRSGGMYGNPESQYTMARPSSSGSSPTFSPYQMFGKMVRAGIGMDAAVVQSGYEINQANLNLEALRKEREYNIENFEQNMADVLASNKMSFYASGLDLSSGTAANVMAANQGAMQKDLSMMAYNYDIQERNIKNAKKASKDRFKSNIISSVASIF